MISRGRRGSSTVSPRSTPDRGTPRQYAPSRPLSREGTPILGANTLEDLVDDDLSTPERTEISEIQDVQDTDGRTAVLNLQLAAEKRRRKSSGRRKSMITSRLSRFSELSSFSRKSFFTLDTTTISELQEEARNLDSSVKAKRRGEMNEENDLENSELQANSAWRDLRAQSSLSRHQKQSVKKAQGKASVKNVKKTVDELTDHLVAESRRAVKRLAQVNTRLSLDSSGILDSSTASLSDENDSKDRTMDEEQLARLLQEAKVPDGSMRVTSEHDAADHDSQHSEVMRRKLDDAPLSNRKRKSLIDSGTLSKRTKPYDRNKKKRRRTASPSMLDLIDRQQSAGPGSDAESFSDHSEAEEEERSIVVEEESVEEEDRMNNTFDLLDDPDILGYSPSPRFAESSSQESLSDCSAEEQTKDSMVSPVATHRTTSFFQSHVVDHQGTPLHLKSCLSSKKKRQSQVTRNSLRKTLLRSKVTFGPPSAAEFDYEEPPLGGVTPLKKEQVRARYSVEPAMSEEPRFVDTELEDLFGSHVGEEEENEGGEEEEENEGGEKDGDPRLWNEPIAEEADSEDDEEMEEELEGLRQSMTSAMKISEKQMSSENLKNKFDSLLDVSLDDSSRSNQLGQSELGTEDEEGCSEQGIEAEEDTHVVASSAEEPEGLKSQEPRRTSLEKMERGLSQGGSFSTDDSSFDMNKSQTDLLSLQRMTNENEYDQEASEVEERFDVASTSEDTWSNPKEMIDEIAEEEEEEKSSPKEASEEKSKCTNLSSLSLPSNKVPSHDETKSTVDFNFTISSNEIDSKDKMNTTCLGLDSEFFDFSSSLSHNQKQSERTDPSNDRSVASNQNCVPTSEDIFAMEPNVGSQGDCREKLAKLAVENDPTLLLSHVTFSAVEPHEKAKRSETRQSITPFGDSVNMSSNEIITFDTTLDPSDLPSFADPNSSDIVNDTEDVIETDLSREVVEEKKLSSADGSDCSPRTLQQRLTGNALMTDKPDVSREPDTCKEEEVVTQKQEQNPSPTLEDDSSSEGDLSLQSVAPASASKETTSQSEESSHSIENSSDDASTQGTEVAVSKQEGLQSVVPIAREEVTANSVADQVIVNSAEQVHKELPALPETQPTSSQHVLQQVLQQEQQTHQRSNARVFSQTSPSIRCEVDPVQDLAAIATKLCDKAVWWSISREANTILFSYKDHLIRALLDTETYCLVSVEYVANHAAADPDYEAEYEQMKRLKYTTKDTMQGVVAHLSYDTLSVEQDSMQFFWAHVAERVLRREVENVQRYHGSSLQGVTSGAQNPAPLITQFSANMEKIVERLERLQHDLSRLQLRCRFSLEFQEKKPTSMLLAPEQQLKLCFACVNLPRCLRVDVDVVLDLVAFSTSPALMSPSSPEMKNLTVPGLRAYCHLGYYPKTPRGGTALNKEKVDCLLYELNRRFNHGVSTTILESQGDNSSAVPAENLGTFVQVHNYLHQKVTGFHPE